MNEGAILLLLLCVALGLHALVSLLNAALQNVSPSSMRERADDGDATARRYLVLTDDPLRLGMTVSITHILTRVAFAALLLLLMFEASTMATPGRGCCWRPPP